MLTNTTRAPRRCSLCRSNQHDIRNCNNYLIRKFRRTLRHNSYDISRFSINGIPLIVFYLYLQILEERHLNLVPYKLYLMNRGISSRQLVNTIETRSQLVKYYFMPEESYEEFKTEYLRQKDIYNNLTDQQKNQNTQIVRDMINAAYDELFENNNNSDIPLFTNISGTRLTEEMNRVVYVDVSVVPQQQLYIQKPQIIFTLEQIKISECCICFNNDEMAKLNCNHDVCKNCTKELINRNNLSCPLCREQITNICVSTLDTYNLLHT